MGIFSKKNKVDGEALTSLQGEMAQIRERMDTNERIRTALESHVTQMDSTTRVLADRTQALDELNVRLAEIDVLKRQVAHLDVVHAKIASLETLSGKLTELADRVNTTSDDARSAKDQVVSLHERISNVSQELANQLDELSKEIDNLSVPRPTMPPPPAPTLVAEQLFSPDVLDKLSTAQVRLANEQARYEIAFRQDLAMLADQLQRKSSSS